LVDAENQLPWTSGMNARSYPLEIQALAV
jgi:hypothetical protein